MGFYLFCLLYPVFMILPCCCLLSIIAKVCKQFRRRKILGSRHCSSACALQVDFIKNRNLAGVVRLLYIFFSFFFSGLQMKRLLTPFYIGLHFIFQNLVWMPFTSFFLSSWKENQYCIRTAVAVMGHQSLSRLSETTVSSGI